MARFLSDEYLAAASDALTRHEGFRHASRNVDLSVQFRVSDVPVRGDVAYTLVLAGGEATIVTDREAPSDVSVSNNYPTAVGISKGELNTQMAFFTGKIKVGGNMGALLANQAVISEFAHALSEIDVEY